MTDKAREEFESAFTARYSNSINRNMTTKQYDDPATQTAWWAWRASRAAIVIELPDMSGIAERAPRNEYAAIRLDQQEQCREAIEAAGVKVRP